MFRRRGGGRRRRRAGACGRGPTATANIPSPAAPKVCSRVAVAKFAELLVTRACRAVTVVTAVRAVTVSGQPSCACRHDDTRQALTVTTPYHRRPALKAARKPSGRNARNARGGVGLHLLGACLRARASRGRRRARRTDETPDSDLTAQQPSPRPSRHRPRRYADERGGAGSAVTGQPCRCITYTWTGMPPRCRWSGWTDIAS